MNSASVVLVYGICDESVYDKIARIPCVFTEDDGCICAVANRRDYQSVAKRIYSKAGIRPMYAEGTGGDLYPLPKEW